MLINILDKVIVKIEGDECSVLNFIKEEYAAYISENLSLSPDIHVRLVDEEMPENSYIVRPPVSYDDKSVFIFDSERRILRINFDSIGKGTTEVVCDRRFNPDFFAIALEYLLHLTFVSCGAYFCHSCVFDYGGKVVLCPGWRNVGKTNLLLSFLQEGAYYIADDWSLIYEDGQICSLPKRLNLLFYNLFEFPSFVSLIGERLSGLVEFTYKAVQGQFQLNNKILKILKEKARTRIGAERLFGTKVRPQAKKVDYIFLLKRKLNDSVKGISIYPLTFENLSTYIQETLHYEQKPFRLAYSIHKAMFGKKNLFLEKEQVKVRNMIYSSLSHVKPLYEIHISGQNNYREAKEEIVKIFTSKNE